MNAQQKQVISNCRKSVSWFLKSMGRIKHPAAGIIPFKPFEYQKKAISAFRTNRFTVFRKTRQCGISKICGAFALWYALFFNVKTILIVSRTDEDAMNFLADNVKFLFHHLPPWMQEMWAPVKDNEHEMKFPNGSVIRSKSSHPDVLRSNASSLNIIDEAAFIQHMGPMWAAAWPTMQHGGSCIVISTCNGVGNWYWATYTDAVAGVSPFTALEIMWWDMDWAIEYTDPLSNTHRRLAPTDGIRDCLTPEEQAKYGPKWSPWLEEQYRGLQSKGEIWRFQQEVLADFIGSGNTVLSQAALTHVSRTVNDTFDRVINEQTYVHPVNGERMVLDFTTPERDEGFWVWKRPDRGEPEKKRGNTVIDPGRPGHTYVAGLDIATGKGNDYHALEVFDVDEREQVAELMVRCLPRDLRYMVDYICRWYNSATLVIERNNGGDAFIDEMRYELMYPKLWRKRDINDKPGRKSGSPVQLAKYGFFTSISSKPVLNKMLANLVREDEEEGYKIYSRRFHKQAQIYVRKRDQRGHDTSRTEAEDGAGNHDDLIIATGLAFVGIQDAVIDNSSNMVPLNVNQVLSGPEKPFSVDIQKEWAVKGGPQLVMPVVGEADSWGPETIEQEMLKYAMQLGGIPIVDSALLPSVTTPKHTYKLRK